MVLSDPILTSRKPTTASTTAITHNMAIGISSTGHGAEQAATAKAKIAVPTTTDRQAHRPNSIPVAASGVSWGAAGSAGACLTAFFAGAGMPTRGGSEARAGVRWGGGGGGSDFTSGVLAAPSATTSLGSSYARTG